MPFDAEKRGPGTQRDRRAGSAPSRLRPESRRSSSTALPSSQAAKGFLGSMQIQTHDEPRGSTRARAGKSAFPGLVPSASLAQTNSRAGTDKQRGLKMRLRSAWVAWVLALIPATAFAQDTPSERLK